MALTTLAQLNGAFPGQKYDFYRVVPSGTAGAGAGISLWKAPSSLSLPPIATANPPTGAGEALTSATTGAFSSLINASGSNQLYLGEIEAMVGSNSGTGVEFALMLYDRLVHTSGLVTNVTTEQTVNTTALTRYTDGTGVQAWLEHYTATAGSGTFTVSYTNQAGTSGRTSTAVTLSAPQQHWFQRIPLQAGDTGVRSVQSVTYSVAHSGAGGCGITLARPLAVFRFSANRLVRSDWMKVLVPIEDDAALAFAYPQLMSASTAQVSCFGRLTMIEG